MWKLARSMSGKSLDWKLRAWTQPLAFSPRSFSEITKSAAKSFLTNMAVPALPSLKLL